MHVFIPTLTLLLAHISPTIADADDISVSHHIIYSYPGPTIPSTLLDAARSGKLGGVIFYSENIDTATDLPAQIRALQSAYAESPGYDNFPLLLVTDQEGGLVNRLPGGPTDSAKSIGSSPDPPSAARAAASTIASIFAQYGINADLAPVLDVHRHPNDFTDREQRSFSSDPAQVALAASPWISTLQARNVPATAKHFPGLGAAAAEENTDLRPVTISLSADELREVDMLPYRTAIQQAGIKMIMASWAIYPALSPSGLPAGLSRDIIQTELRQNLNFTGVTITDALEAGSLKPFGNTGELAVMACQAGMDIVLASVRKVSQGEEAHAAIVAALREGRIDREEFEAATERIVGLRRGLL